MFNIGWYRDVSSLFMIQIKTKEKYNPKKITESYLGEQNKNRDAFESAG